MADQQALELVGDLFAGAEIAAADAGDGGSNGEGRQVDDAELGAEWVSAEETFLHNAQSRLAGDECKLEIGIVELGCDFEGGAGFLHAHSDLVPDEAAGRVEYPAAAVWVWLFYCFTSGGRASLQQPKSFVREGRGLELRIERLRGGEEDDCHVEIAGADALEEIGSNVAGNAGLQKRKVLAQIEDGVGQLGAGDGVRKSESKRARGGCNVE